jgi:hypothetical protein
MDTYSFGTGYFVTADLVLTARHTVRDQQVTKLRVRTEADGRWRAARAEPIWDNQLLDAALVHVDDGLDDVPDVQWVTQPFADSPSFQSSGYPFAAKVNQQGKTERKQVGLNGKLNHLGGGGQGVSELELQVEAPPKADDWSGISGAPVFVGDRLAGFIKEVPASFHGNRLAGTRSASLLQDARFLVATAPSWLEPDPDRVLVVLSEQGKISLDDRVRTSLSLPQHQELLRSSEEGPRIAPNLTPVKITEALSSPGKFLQFVRALCAARFAIFDVTGTEPEPAVMLALGIRSVVRRGVTITSTAKKLAEKDLSALPFSIKETKLIHHGNSGLRQDDARHPNNMIATAILEGWRELRSQPNYLDLPVYDAVRCPAPILSTVAKGRKALQRILVLCPFRNSYEEQFQRIADAITSKYPGHPPERMLDITSPRLVGQALYENIRWSTTCIVDFTHWRANVFFELGARLACTAIDPVCLVERSARDQAQAENELTQKQLLMTLFAPAVYDAESEVDAVHPALERHEAISAGRPPPTAIAELPPGAIYSVCEQGFQWRQERILEEPHQALRQDLEAMFGNDPQALGQPAVLFAANREYRRELEHSIRERWIAAWYYLANRYPRDRWRTDEGLRKNLKTLANDVILHASLRFATEPALKSLCAQIDDVVDELDELAKANP